MAAYTGNPVPTALCMTPATPILVAHRGDATNYLENTLPAFESAFRLGIRHVELDVQISSDGIPLVLHDANARRTHGIDLDVRRHDLATLAGNGLFDTEAFDCPIPKLDEFVDWMVKHPPMHVFVEIKKESLHTRGRESVLSAVMAALRPIEGRYTLISYDARVLGMAKRQGRPVGYVLPTMGERYRAIALHLSPQVLFADYRQLMQSGTLWPGPWKWATFEVADRAIARRMTDLGVNYVETMNPAMLNHGTRLARM